MGMDEQGQEKGAGEKSGRKRLWEWAKGHPVPLAVVGVAVLPFLAAGVICGIEGKLPILREFTVDQWAALFGGILTYAGTCFVGILAVWQNIRQKESNDEAQKRLDGFNRRLIAIQESELKPILSILMYIGRHDKQSLSLQLYVKNKGSISMCTAIKKAVLSTPSGIEEHTINIPYNNIGRGKEGIFSFTFPLDNTEAGNIQSGTIQFYLNYSNILETHYEGNATISFTGDESNLTAYGGFVNVS